MTITQIYSAVACILITKAINQDTYSEAADKSNEQAAFQYVSFNSRDFRKLISFIFIPLFTLCLSSLSFTVPSVLTVGGVSIELSPVDTLCSFQGRI